MEISTSAASTAMKVGVQVVSNQKRPLLEIYHQVYNKFGPETEHETDLGHGQKTKFKHRNQEIFVQFTLINIGAERAENIKLTISGDLRREWPKESYPPIFHNVYPQIAPGQIIYLFKFTNNDLLKWEYDEHKGKPVGMKMENLIITMEYDPPNGLINNFLRLPWSLRGKRRYIDTYEFFPSMVEGDLPPAEYA